MPDDIAAAFIAAIRIRGGLIDMQLETSDGQIGARDVTAEIGRIRNRQAGRTNAAGTIRFDDIPTLQDRARIDRLRRRLRRLVHRKEPSGENAAGFVIDGRHLAIALVGDLQRTSGPRRKISADPDRIFLAGHQDMGVFKGIKKETGRGDILLMKNIWIVLRIRNGLAVEDAPDLQVIVQRAHRYATGGSRRRPKKLYLRGMWHEVLELAIALQHRRDGQDELRRRGGIADRKITATRPRGGERCGETGPVIVIGGDAYPVRALRQLVVDAVLAQRIQVEIIPDKG